MKSGIKYFYVSPCFSSFLSLLYRSGCAVKQNGGVDLNKIILISICLIFSLHADEVYSKNKKANKLFEQGKYEGALSLYDEALLESPQEKKLAINKGSTLYRLEDFNAAEESYESALSVEDVKARANLHYNMGNVYNMQGDRLMQSGNQQAMEKYKAARDSYIKALDLKPDDHDAKWNLQLTQMKIKQMEQQQQQQNNQDNKNQQNQDKNQQQDKNNKQDQKNQQDQEQKKDENKQQQNQEQKDQQKQQQQPKPQQSKEEMEKEEALRLLRQYADDDKDLNKPQEKMRALTGKKPEKDW
jgi:Ca-activated chloride channel family protein